MHKYGGKRNNNGLTKGGAFWLEAEQKRTALK